MKGKGKGKRSKKQEKMPTKEAAAALVTLDIVEDEPPTTPDNSDEPEIHPHQVIKRRKKSHHP